MSLLQKVHERFNIVNSLMWSATTTRPSMEVVYRELFLRDLARLGLDDLYYPVGWAANHSLMYLIARCFIELPVVNVLELGGGQSSILLSQLNDRLKREATHHDGRARSAVGGQDPKAGEPSGGCHVAYPEDHRRPSDSSLWGVPRSIGPLRFRSDRRPSCE